MKKILILGGKGMAGHLLTLYLEKLNKYKVFNTVRSSILDENSLFCDVFSINDISQIITKLKPNIVINCIGILNDKSDLSVNDTVFINSFFPHFLEKMAELNNLKIIHLSTDCVFTGKKGAYKENDLKDETSLYGLSKGIGEIINKNDLTIRTSIIGPELKSNGKGLFHWFMNQSGTVNGYTNVYWTGVTTLELAKAIDKAISSNLTGLYHLVPQNKISKYDLLKIIQNEFNKNSISLTSYINKKVDKSLINTRNDFNFEVNDYETMIKELKKWMLSHQSLYIQYLNI